MKDVQYVLYRMFSIAENVQFYGGFSVLCDFQYCGECLVLCRMFITVTTLAIASLQYIISQIFSQFADIFPLHRELDIETALQNGS